MDVEDVKLLRRALCYLQKSVGYEVKAESGTAAVAFERMCEDDLKRAHELASLMLKRLEAQVANDDRVAFELLFGDKESMIGALNKLSALLLKLIQLEQKLMENKQAEEDFSLEYLTQQDAEFLEQYVDYVTRNSCVE
jgi:hypothetical protein